uniref:Uncharacterized protein n=1 Tax=Arundo donax TaxID=35708 RepID=A0A0A8ZYM2_ARUDO
MESWFIFISVEHGLCARFMNFRIWKFHTCTCGAYKMFFVFNVFSLTS